MLCVGKDMAALPGPGDASYDEADPQLPQDLEEYEWAKAIKSDLCRGVLGLWA